MRISYSFRNPALLLLAMSLSVMLSSQKDPAVMTASFNSSRSNLYRIVYASNAVTPLQAQTLIQELDKQGLIDSSALKQWLPANFKRLGIDPGRVKGISIFIERQYKDCLICRKHCRGRCVQEPGSDCVCIQHSEPNLRLAAGEKMRTLIFLSDVIMDEEASMEAAATTVKSSKSNSSE